VVLYVGAKAKVTEANGKVCSKKLQHALTLRKHEVCDHIKG
jgi:hypothetical protein